MKLVGKPKYFTYYNEILGRKEQCAEIHVLETVNVKGIPIQNINTYDVDADKINDHSYYWEPLNDPDFNIRNLNKKYDLISRHESHQ